MLELDLLKADYFLVEFPEIRQERDLSVFSLLSLSLDKARLGLAGVCPGLGLASQDPLRLEDLLDLGQLVRHQLEVVGGVPLHVSLKGERGETVRL